MDAQFCPLCGESPSPRSRDHIFPRFLGGTRCVVACKPCNDEFGHTFEAAANEEMFLPMHVYLAALGLKTVRDGAELRNAYARDGVPYNLSVNGGRLVERVAKPIIRKNAAGQVESARFADEHAARSFLRTARERGQKVLVVKDDDRERPTEPGWLGFECGANVQRVALKIALAASALLPDLDASRTAAGRSELRTPLEEDCLRSCATTVGYADLMNATKPLEHAVFVESTASRVYAVVQFFGFFQFYCALGECPSRQRPSALFASLDPIDGAESFRSAAPYPTCSTLATPILRRR